MDPCNRDLNTLLKADLDTHFPRLILDHQQKLYALAYHMVCNKQDAEEIVQDALIRAYNALSKFSSEEIQQLKIRSWLLKIAYNLALNRLTRRNGRSVNTIFIDSDDGRDIFEYSEHFLHQSPEMEVECKESYNELLNEISCLPDKLRIPVVLHYVIGLEFSEVAELLGQPFNTVKSNAHRGIKKLRETLKKTQVRKRG